MCVNFTMLSVRLRSTADYLIVEFWECQQLHVDFRLHGEVDALFCC